MNFVWISFIVLIIDQITKYFVSRNFYLGESVQVIPNVFHWTYILNPGAAFGMLDGSRWFFVGIAVLVSVGVWFFRKELQQESAMVQNGTALFVGGAIGNLIDRIFIGQVIDFFDFRIWPIFNVADIAICVGVGLIIWNIIMTEFLNSRND